MSRSGMGAGPGESRTRRDDSTNADHATTDPRQLGFELELGSPTTAPDDDVTSTRRRSPSRAPGAPAGLERGN